MTSEVHDILRGLGYTLHTVDGAVAERPDAPNYFAVHESGRTTVDGIVAAQLAKTMAKPTRNLRPGLHGVTVA